MNRIFKSTKSFFINDYLLIFKFVKKKDFLFLVTLLLFFIYISLFVGTPRIPFNYIYNAVFALMVVLITIFVLKRKAFRFDSFVLFWLLFLVVVYAYTFANGLYKTAPLAEAVVAIFVFELFQACDEDQKKLLLRSVYFGFLVLLVQAVFRYTIPLIKIRNDSAFDDYFGNLDGFSNNLAILTIFGFYFFTKGDFFALVVGLISSIFALATERRTSYIILAVAFLALLYHLCSKKKGLFFFLSFLGIIAAVVGLFFVPVFSGLRNRLLQSFIGLDGSYSDPSAMERINMNIRGVVYAFGNLFRGFGYEGFTRYSGTGDHNTFGDLAVAYGGLYALLASFYFFFVLFKLLDTKGEDYFLCFSLSFCLLILYPLGAIFVTRNYCYIFALAYSASPFAHRDPLSDLKRHLSWCCEPKSRNL